MTTQAAFLKSHPTPQARVRLEHRLVYVVPGGRTRFTRPAAYREAARVMILAACDCTTDGDGWHEPVDFSPCRFHGAEIVGFAFEHRDARSRRSDGLYDLDGTPSTEGEWHGPKGDGTADGGRAYYVLVRDRLARWLMWRDGTPAIRLAAGRRA